MQLVKTFRGPQGECGIPGVASDIFPLGVAEIATPGGMGVVSVRGVSPLDVGAYHRVYGDPAVVEYDDFEALGMDEARKDVSEVVSSYGKALTTSFVLAVDYDPSGDPLKQETVGFLHLVDSPLHGRPAWMVGYHLDPRFWGMGIAKAALRLLLGELEDTRPQFALVYEQNKNSIGLLKACGFKHDKGYRKVLTTKGEPRVELRYVRPMWDYEHDKTRNNKETSA